MSHTTLLPTTDAAAITLAGAAEISAAGIVSRTLVQSAELRVVLFSFDQGQELTGHSSKRRALVQVLSGACDFFFNGQWTRLEAGALLHMPPDHPHAVRASHGPFTMLLTLGAEQAAKISSS
ncbi:cupin [Nibricoccus aquaticus]|uniref:Cupin n=1 Tax=Nibricoccus aquaticus TaxID=2576891 RepID=A0A290QDY0_9BACT|nr:cupin domain-containing protein [Nibricoccus aquaticus]ATC63538.1 cupin [Nibricoccus aquaticus]